MGSVQPVPVVIDRLGHIFAIEPKLLGFNDELFEFRLEQVSTFGCCRRRPLGNGSAAARMDFEQSLVNELRDHFVRRVRIDLERPAQSPNRWKRVTGSHLAGNQGLLSRVDDLFVDGNAGLE